MENLFVPYELAVLAKEKGFNEATLACYELDGCFAFLPYNDENINLDTELFSAPIYQQLVDWFREEHNILVIVDAVAPRINELSGYYSSIEGLNKNNIHRASPLSSQFVRSFNTASFKNYYEALTEAIKEAFKLI